MTKKKTKRPFLGERPTDKLKRQMMALTDRVARLEVRPNAAASADTVRAAVVAEFDSTSLRPLAVPKEFRELHPAEFERIVNTAWTNVAKRLAGEA